MLILGYLQKLGRALMVPVATLPAAAILIGLGYWIDPDGWGNNSALAAFFLASGKAIIDNMPLLFAIGISYGLSKDKDGAAALSGLVCFLVVTTLLSPATVAQLENIAVSAVPSAFSKINNPFIGIIVGIISSELYNRYHHIELHAALAFFSGKRLIPILTSLAGIVLSFILLFIWPFVYNGLIFFGESILNLGAVGAGLYGFLNRLLIPIGLHHALNSVFWFDVAGINDIPNFLSGAKSIADGSAVIGVTGQYQAGFFPIMMFGLPGAALAIYQTAKAENKEKVASIMLAAALAAFLTGVTEPLEFSFMFVAPLLYVLHALLTGISVFIAAHMQWIAGFGFSAGLVDFILSSRNPLAVSWYMLIPQGLVFFTIYYVSFKLLIIKYNLHTPGREKRELDDEIDEAIVSMSSDNELSEEQQFISALGGAHNLSYIDACISRLRLSVVSMDDIDETALKRLGAMGVVKLNQHDVQVVIGAKAEQIASKMKVLVNVGS